MFVLLFFNPKQALILFIIMYLEMLLGKVKFKRLNKSCISFIQHCKSDLVCGILIVRIFSFLHTSAVFLAL